MSTCMSACLSLYICVCLTSAIYVLVYARVSVYVRTNKQITNIFNDVSAKEKVTSRASTNTEENCIFIFFQVTRNVT